MTVDEHKHGKSLTIRRPGVVPAAAPLGWQIDKHTDHNDRLTSNAASPIGLDTEDIPECANDEGGR
ncbi:hypothetical protein ACIP88_32810 [Streptomyces uncialis]|uniref:hypothetical protein n=1 Tax=Streptomyces uncialis TaxID=1048205 RepID=UPI00382361F3